MQIIRVFVCAVLLAIAAGCSSLPSETPAEQSQAAYSYHAVQNGSLGLQQNATRFCRMLYMGGVNAHQGSATWANGVAKNGAAFGVFPPTLSAYPVSTFYGSATAGAACNDFADFGFGPSASQSSDTSPYYLLWSTAYGMGPVNGTVNLWYYPSGFCFLNGVNSMSAAAETVHVYPQGVIWKLGAYGYPVIGGSAKCIFPDRAYTISGPHAVSSGGVAWGPASANSFCAFTKVIGSLDEGWIAITNQSGYWKLEASGVSAEMTCAVF